MNYPKEYYSDAKEIDHMYGSGLFEHKNIENTE